MICPWKLSRAERVFAQDTSVDDSRLKLKRVLRTLLNGFGLMKHDAGFVTVTTVLKMLVCLWALRVQMHFVALLSAG